MPQIASYLALEGTGTAVGTQVVGTEVGTVVVLVGIEASAAVDTQVVVETVVVDKVMELAVDTQAVDIAVDNQAAETEVGRAAEVGTQVVVEQVEAVARTVLPTSLGYSFSIYFLIASVGPGTISPSWNPTDNMNIHAPKPTWSRNSTASSCAS